MRHHQHGAVRQHGIRPWNTSHQVDQLHLPLGFVTAVWERLTEAVVPNRFQAGTTHLLLDPGRREGQARSPESPPLHLRGGQRLGVRDQALGVEPRRPNSERSAIGHRQGRHRPLDQLHHQRRADRLPHLLGHVLGLVAAEREERIPTVVRQLAREPGDGLDRIGGDPADRVPRVIGPRHGDERTVRALEGLIIDPYPIICRCDPVDREPLDERCGVGVVPAQQPGVAPRERITGLAVVHHHGCARSGPGLRKRPPRVDLLGRRRGRHHEQRLVAAEQPRQRGRHLARIELAHHVEGGVHVEAQGLTRAIDRRVEGPVLGLDLDPHGLGLSLHGDRDRQPHRERRTGLGLTGVQRQFPATPPQLDRHHLDDLDAGGAGARGPRVEESPPDPVLALVQGRANILEGGPRERVVPVESSERRAERLVADLPADHVEQHRGLAVSDRLGGRRGARPELGDRQIGRAQRVIGVLL